MEIVLFLSQVKVSKIDHNYSRVAVFIFVIHQIVYYKFRNFQEFCSNPEISSVNLLTFHYYFELFLLNTPNITCVSFKIPVKYTKLVLL